MQVTGHIYKIIASGEVREDEINWGSNSYQVKDCRGHKVLKTI